jgi:hypothetical protein
LASLAWVSASDFDGVPTGGVSARWPWPFLWPFLALVLDESLASTFSAFLWPFFGALAGADAAFAGEFWR